MIGDEAEPSTTIRAPVRHRRHVHSDCRDLPGRIMWDPFVHGVRSYLTKSGSAPPKIVGKARLGRSLPVNLAKGFGGYVGMRSQG